LLFSVFSWADGPNIELIAEFGVHGSGYAESSLVVFDDRQFVFDSNTGGFGRCQAAKAGRFKGKLTQEQYAGLMSEAKKTAKACEESGACLDTNQAAPRSAFWVVRQKDGSAKLIPDSPVMPKVIAHILELDLLQQPLRAVELSLERGKEKFTARLKNISATNITLPMGEFRQLGKEKPLTVQGPKFKALKPGESVQFQLPNIPEGERIEYNNSTDAHHFDEEGRVFRPCASVDAGKH
jgi:hypothetical protein